MGDTATGVAGRGYWRELPRSREGCDGCLSRTGLAQNTSLVGLSPWSGAMQGLAGCVFVAGLEEKAVEWDCGNIVHLLVVCLDGTPFSEVET